MKQNWAGQKILIIGAARQGLSLTRYLSARGAQVTLNDQRPMEKMRSEVEALSDLPVNWVLGSHPLELLEGVQRVSISGGVPLTLPIIQEAQARGLHLTNDSQIFMEEVQAPVIGITGSAGKTTTTTLLGRMAAAATAAEAATAAAVSTKKRSAWVGGNIGLPLIEFVDEIQPADLVIVEFSSFQLELMTTSPHLGAVLNITPNHLDRHGTLQAYAAAKARILEFQSGADVAILSRDDPGAWALNRSVRGKLVSFGFVRPEIGQAGTFIAGDHLYFTDGQMDQELMPCKLIRLRGAHNMLNVLAASAIACAAGFPIRAIQAGVEGFNGVAHRLEYVRTWKGADWYNASISTAPERTMADIRVFDEPLVLLLGGRDKDLPWEKLAALVHQRVDHVIVFGEAAGKILSAIGPTRPGQRLQTIHHQTGLQSAVQAAAEIVEPGDIVLFSPGGTSFDEFKDFEERGERFREWVKALT